MSRLAGGLGSATPGPFSVDKGHERAFEHLTGDDMKLLREGDLYEDESESNDGGRGNGGADRVLRTLCDCCSYLAAQFGSSAKGSELRDQVVWTWAKHVRRFHPENESLSKSIATMEALQAKRKH